MVKSKLPDVDIPEIPLHRLVLDNIEKHADRVAYIDSVTGKSYTYREFRELCFKISSVLAQRGIKKGDVLAIVCLNCPEFALFLFGAMAVGGVLTTVNPLYTIYELSHQIEDAGATSIFCAEADAPKMKQVAATNPKIKDIYVIGSAPGCIPFNCFTEYTGPSFDYSKVSFNPKNDVAVIPYSSGTTGLPKGVCLTHFNLVANTFQVKDTFFIRPGTNTSQQARLLALSPFFHLMGLASMVIRAPLRGAQVITMPRFHPEEFLSNIQTYKINYLSIPPPVVVFMAKSHLTDKYDLSSVREVHTGASPLSLEMEQLFQQKLGIPMVQGYGLTETSPTATRRPWTDNKPGSIGILIPNTEIKIVDVFSGRELGPNEVGEIWIRGPQVMKGYHNRPEETSNMVDEEGWLHSGDIGYYDEEEHFYATDRIKELIKYKGFQVAPAELESLLLTHPGISEAAVTSVPDQEAGELPVAYVVLKDKARISEHDIIHYVAERAASFKHLRGGVHIVDNIPKTDTGKLLRRVLKEQAAKDTKRSNL